MKKMKIFLLISFISINLFAGMIKGKVTLGNDNSVIAGVSVLLMDKKVRFSTDANGNFNITNLTPITTKLALQDI